MGKQYLEIKSFVVLVFCYLHLKAFLIDIFTEAQNVNEIVLLVPLNSPERLGHFLP